jgi:hypothetical protein
MAARIERLSYRALAATLAVLLAVGMVPALAFTGVFAESAGGGGLS